MIATTSAQNSCSSFVRRRIRPRNQPEASLRGRIRRRTKLEQLFCAEVVAITYERMGLLDATRPPNWYDPGKFWSGDRLDLAGATLGPEVAVRDIPPFELAD